MSQPNILDRDPMEDDLRAFTPAQVGDLLALSEDTVRKMVAAGQLKTIQVWGKMRITAPAIRAYLQRADKSYRPRQRAS